MIYLVFPVSDNLIFSKLEEYNIDLTFREFLEDDIGYYPINDNIIKIIQEDLILSDKIRYFIENKFITIEEYNNMLNDIL